MSEISSVLKESRKFNPSKEFSKKAEIKTLAAYQKLRKQVEKNPVAFWTKQAKDLHWQKPFKKALEWKHPFAKWFVGGKLNAAENALDIHLNTARRNKAALIWEAESGETRTLTYLQLALEVNQLANALKFLGVKKGDVVGIYMGMIPEAVVSMLACARVGATHNVVFGGFSPDALRDRLNDSKAKVLLTQDGAFRKGAPSALKSTVHDALDEVSTLQHVVVYKRTGQNTPMKTDRDLWWHELVSKQFY